MMRFCGIRQSFDSSANFGFALNRIDLTEHTPQKPQFASLRLDSRERQWPAGENIHL
jgi:hypothetical protein